MPNGDEVKESVSAPVEGGFKVPEDQIIVSAGEVFRAPKDQIIDLPPSQAESDEFNSLLNEQLLSASEAFAAPETTLPRIDKLTPETIERSEEAFRQLNQEQVNFFTEFDTEKTKRIAINQPIPDIIPIDKALTESVDALLFGEDVRDSRAYAIEHIKRFDPERFGALQDRIEEGKFREQDDIDLVNEGIKLKSEALRLMFDEKERQIQEEADELVSSEEFQQLSELAGEKAETLDEQLTQRDEVKNLGLSLSDEIQAIAEELDNLEEQSDTFVQKEFPKTAEKILNSQTRQLLTDVRYVSDPQFRLKANTVNLMVRAVTGVFKGLANIPGVDAVLTPVVDKFSEDNRDEFSEIISNWVDVFNDITAPVPTRTKQGRALFEDQAEVTVGGQKLDVIFEQDRVIDVRVKEGSSVSEELAQKAINEFDANPVEIKSTIDEGLLLPKMVSSLSEIALLIGGARTVTRGLSALGASERTSKVAGLFTANFVMMNDGFYREAKNQGLSDNQSVAFATASAATATAVMLLNPGKFIFGRESVTKFTKQYADILTKGVPTRQALKETFKAGTKEALNFNLFVGSLAAADNVTKYVTNKLTGKDAFDFEITANQIKEDLIINSLTGFLIGTAQGLPSSQISRLQKDALFSAAVEKDTFVPRITEKIRDGEIDKSTGEQLIAKIEEIAGNIGNIPENITVRDKSELMSLLSERLDLKRKTKDENLGEAFKKESEERLEQIDNEMADIIARKPVEPEKPVREKKPAVELKELEEPTAEEFGEIIEVDVKGKETRREILTEEQFKAEEVKAKEVEPEVPPKPPEAKEIKRIDAEIEAERTKIEEQKKLEEPDTEVISVSEAKIKELEAQKVKAEPVKEVKAEDITREDEVIDTKIEVKPEKDIDKERETARREEIKKETGEDLPETSEDIRIIEESKTLNDISQTRRDIKEDKIVSPQDLKDKIDKTIDDIRKAKAVGAKDLPFLQNVSEDVLSDIKKKADKAENFNELEEQFSRLEKEIEDRALQQVQEKLLRDIKKETTRTTTQRKELSDFVNEELDRIEKRVSLEDAESFTVQRSLIVAEWNRQNPNTILPESILREIENLNKQNLEHLSNFELKEVLDDIGLLKSQGTTFNRLKMARAQKQTDETIKEFNKDILAGKELKPRGEILPEVKKTLTKLTTDAIERALGLSLLLLNFPLSLVGAPVFLRSKLAQKTFNISALKQMLNNNNRFDILEENAKGTVYRGKILEFFRGIVNQAREVAYDDVVGKTTTLQAKMAELNLQNLDREVDVQGRKMERRQLMRIFMATKDPTQLKSLLNKKVGNGLSKELLKAIENELTTEEKQMVEWLLESFQKIHPEVDAVYRQSNFMPLPKNPGFSPILKLVELLDQVKDFDILGFHLSGKGREKINPSFIQKRSGSESALNLDIGAVELYIEYVKRTSQYKALELPLKEINAVIKGIKDAVVQEQGINHFKLLTQWSENLVSDGRYTTSKLERFAKNLRTGLTKGILSANVVVALKQTISGTAFLTELTEVQMGAAIKEYWNPKNNFENARKWNKFMDDNARKQLKEGNLTGMLRTL